MREMGLTVRTLMCALTAVVVVGLAATPVAGAQEGMAKKEFGYIPLPDGTKLRYTVLLPEGKGPFPVLMQYEGYSAGSDPTRANVTFVPRMLKQGYAVVGVNLRGAGCSQGTWKLFNRQQGQDGAFAVDWLAQKPWANGKVALYSYSYGGIMQLWVAAERPKHLVALTPSAVVADTYRDIGFPGGIFNVLFPPQWGAALNVDWTLAFRGAVEQGDTECAANYLPHGAQSIPNQLALEQPQHPYDDDWHREHSVRNLVDRIDLPVLGVQSYQDEQTGPRGSAFWDQLDPEKTWLITTNGHHSMYAASDQLHETLDGFYGHFLKGEDNGFQKTPHVQIWHETTYAGPKPRSVTTRERLPVQVAEASIPLGGDGLQPAAAGDTSSYDYPIPSPPITDQTPAQAEDLLRINTWNIIPDPGVGRAVFTTAPLARTATTWGPASADLRVSTTAKDVDLQVTMTEVRPDGQETYVQRGWLRASHRAVDETRSTPTRPWHPHTQASLKDMSPGDPQLMRVEMLPSGHTFRAGSSIRIYVEMPSITGGWGFTSLLDPQTVTVHHAGSRLVLGLLRDAKVLADRPACGTVYYQPCRRSPIAQPGGSLDITPADPPAAAPNRPVQVRFYGRRGRRVLVRVRSLDGRTRKLTVELRRGGRLVARSARLTAGPRLRRVLLTRPRGRRFATGRQSLVVRSSSGKVLLRRTVRLGR